MRWLIPIFLLACGHATNDPDVRMQGVSSVGGGQVTGNDFPRPTNGGRLEPPPTPVSTSADPTDHEASAAAIYDGRNYVEPAELAYSKKLRLVVYPACGGGEGPGEHCSLGAFDSGGATVNVDAKYQVAWATRAGRTEDRQTTIDKLAAAFDALETVRVDRRAWTGTTPLVLPDFGTLSWDRAAKKLIATRDQAISKASIEGWGDKGGPVNVFWTPGVPLAVVQLRMNPGTGGRETQGARTEGYVVFIQLVVVPRP